MVPCPPGQARLLWVQQTGTQWSLLCTLLHKYASHKTPFPPSALYSFLNVEIIHCLCCVHCEYPKTFPSKGRYKMLASSLILRLMHVACL